MAIDKYAKPSEYASNVEKKDDKYALQYANYMHSQFLNNAGSTAVIEEWVENESYRQGYNTPEKLKKLLLNARDQSYGKLSFEQPIIIPKFYKTIKKNLNLELFESKVKAIDATSMSMHEDEKDKLTSKMINGQFKAEMSEFTGVDFNNKGFVPESTEDRDVFLEVEHQLPQEIAMEQAIAVVKEANYHTEILDKLADDVLTYGKCVVTDEYDPELGVIVKRIPPMDYISSYDGSEMNDNRNGFYNAHYEMMSLNDLHSAFGLEESKAINFAKNTTKQANITKLSNKRKWDDINESMVQVMFFEFKTTLTETYSKRIKENNGKISLKERDEDYEFDLENVETIKNVKPVWMEGVWIVDSDILLKYCVRNNQVIDSLKKVRSKYSSYETDEVATVRKLIPHADAMALSMVKMNQMIAAARPKGLAVNISSLLDVPSGADGSGESLSYLTLVEMYNDTGNMLFRQDEFTAGQGLPLVEVENGLPKDFRFYMDMYNHNLLQLNIISGVNEQMAGMGSDSRVSTESNEIALAASIKSIEFVKDAILSCEKRLSENIIIRIQDIDEYDKPFKKYVNALGVFNMRALMDLEKLHPFTYSLAIEMKPSIEERKDLDRDLLDSIARGEITSADRIEVNAIKNLKLAGLVLKRKIAYNIKRNQQNQLEQIQAQQQAEMQKIQADMQKLQVESQNKLAEINLGKEWDYKIKQLELGMASQSNEAKRQDDFGKEMRAAQNKNNIAEFQQGQMNERQKEKIEALKEDKLSKDSEKNMKKV